MPGADPDDSDADHSVTASDGTGFQGVATVRMWSISSLERVRPNWSNLPRQARHNMLTRPARYPTAPIKTARAENLVLDNYLEALASGDSPQPTHLAIGDDDSASPQADSDALNNEVYRTQIGQDEGDGRDRLTSTFISQNEMNGLGLAEIGFANGPDAEDDDLLTHLLLDASDQLESKTSDITITIDYTLFYQRVD
ncbi:hypothetical protein [Natronorarus salvus]|uniref:hypothetical protein n=1 Tax=Natronorarus salvus TaxID=3117733 RepID=UPI002F2618C8